LGGGHHLLQYRLDKTTGRFKSFGIIAEMAQGIPPQGREKFYRDLEVFSVNFGTDFFLCDRTETHVAHRRDLMMTDNKKEAPQ